MKKFRLLILWLCSLFFLWNFTDAKDYEYTNLNITADILIDWTMNIKENFTANFFIQKHGIIRDIPLNYSVKWNNFHIDIDNVNVDLKQFTISTTNKNITIKIWDPNRTVIWSQKYPISYTTYGLIRNFSWMWYAELYWNLVWYGFDTNINKVYAVINLPKPYTWFKSNDFLITTDWKSKTIDWFEWTVDRSQWDKIIITYDKWLPAYQGITLAIKFPNDYFEFEHNKQASLIWSANNNLIFKDYRIWALLCIAVFFPWALTIAMLLATVGNKYELKKEYKKKYPVIVQYNPPKWLNSAEVWLLLCREAQKKHLISLIYQRASKWLISISDTIEVKKRWTLEGITIKKLMDIDEDSPQYEKSFFNNLFKDDDILFLNKSAYIDTRNEIKELQNYGVEKWWLKYQNWIKWIFILLGIVFFIIIMYKFPVIWPQFTVALLSFSIIFCFIIRWEKETEKWAELISHILWYKQFLESCDENRLRLFLKEDPLYFDKILPYAVALWMQTELLDKIKPIMEEMNIEPSRYDWDYASLFDTISSVTSPFSYSTDGWWFDSWSSFDSWWFDSWWGWWGWWWSSW